MLPAQRRDLLVARLERDGRLVAKDLAAELGIAEDSIRRDLRELAAAGLEVFAWWTDEPGDFAVSLSRPAVTG